MQWDQKENYIKILKRIALPLYGIVLITLLVLVCLIAWATTLLATFSLLS